MPTKRTSRPLPVHNLKKKVSALSDKNKAKKILEAFWEQDRNIGELLRIACDVQTDPVILNDLALGDSDYSWCNPIEISYAALKNPSLPAKTILKILNGMRKEQEGFIGRYDCVLENPALTETLLLSYLGKPLAKNQDDYGEYESRKRSVLIHKNCPVAMLEEAAKQRDYLGTLARNTGLPESLIKKIASPTGVLSELPRKRLSETLIYLAKNPAVSQEILRSLVPNENGVWRDGKKPSVLLLKTLSVNLIEGAERQLCLRLLAERSNAKGVQTIVAFLSNEEKTLSKIVGRANQNIARIAADRTADPETSQVMVALRTSGDKDKTRPRKPHTRTA